jgi:hypothetical protein
VSFLEHGLGAADIRRKALKWFLHDQFDPDSGRQMENSIGAGNQIVDQIGIEDRTEHELEIGSTQQVLDIGVLPSREIVERDDTIASFEEQIG